MERGKNKYIKNLKLALLFQFIVILALFSWKSGIFVFAETGGSAPESGATSRIKTLSDAVGPSGLGYGTDTNTPDWGLMWNRVYSAATWNAVLGDAGTGDVLAGKKFYAGANRTLQIGT